jgi:hypothetical protein
MESAKIQGMTEQFSKVLETMISKEICTIIAATTAAPTTTKPQPPLTLENLSEAIHKCRPKYALLLRTDVPYGVIYEKENTEENRYFCERLLITSVVSYENLLRDTLERAGIWMRAYYPDSYTPISFDLGGRYDWG